MKTQGHVLMICLLLLMLCSALALAALQLSLLSQQMNYVLLRQNRLTHEPAVTQVHAMATACTVQLVVWPAEWQQCVLSLQEPPISQIQQLSSGQLVLKQVTIIPTEGIL